MKELTVTIDHLPYSELMPNRKLYWAAKAKVAAIARRDACIEALNCMGTWIAPERASVFYRFTAKDKRKRDLDNLIAASKASLDGLRDAGVIASDDADYLSISGAEIVKGDKAKTELIVREV